MKILKKLITTSLNQNLLVLMKNSVFMYVRLPAARAQTKTFVAEVNCWHTRA